MPEAKCQLPRSRRGVDTVARRAWVITNLPKPLKEAPEILLKGAVPAGCVAGDLERQRWSSALVLEGTS